MNAKDKFALGDAFKLTRIKSGAVIMLHNIYFRGLRKVMRGLEEHLAKGEENHDFINGTYVYKIEDADNHHIFIRFEFDWCVIGSEILYNA